MTDTGHFFDHAGTYTVRMGQALPVGNSVTWPRHASVPGWDGTNYPTLHRLSEPSAAHLECPPRIG